MPASPGPWLLTGQTALLLVGGFVVCIFSVIVGGGGFFVSIPLLQFLFPSVSYGATVPREIERKLLAE